MKNIAQSAAAAVMAAGLLAGGGALAQSQSQTQSQVSKSDNGAGLKVAPADAKASMDNLMEAVKQLREASVLLLNQKDAGPKRAKAFDEAQEAVLQTQRAIASLGDNYRLSTDEIREAKDWPVIAARLDEASQELEAAVKKVSDSNEGGERDAAIESMKKAMTQVNDALNAIPASGIGEASSSKSRSKK